LSTDYVDALLRAMAATITVKRVTLAAAGHRPEDSMILTSMIPTMDRHIGMFQLLGWHRGTNTFALNLPLDKYV
jgi:hypothetical protein